MPRKKESSGNLNLKFKKVTITSDERCFIVKYNDDKFGRNYYYVNFENLLNNLVNKYLLKSEAKKVEQVLEEIKDLKKRNKKIKKIK